MVRMSKGLYLGALIVAFLLIPLCGIPALFLLNSYALPRSMGIDDDITNLSVGLLIFLAIAPFILVHIILTFLTIYKMWSSIQDGAARTTPGRAIGFLLVPFYNLYWIFQVWGGFPTDYNAYIQRHSLQVPTLSQGIYITYPIVIVLSVIPVLGFLAILIAPVIFAIVIVKTSNAVNALAEARQRIKRSNYAPKPVSQVRVGQAI